MEASTSWGRRDNRNGTIPQNYLNDDEKLFKLHQSSVGSNFDYYDSIPVNVKNIDILPITTWSEVGDISSIENNIQRLSYDKLTPVQRYTIPVAMQGRNLIVSAQTGSGKTAAFLFPTIMKMISEGPPSQDRDIVGCSAPIAVILSPTRELALQSYEEARKFCAGTGIRCAAIYGGGTNTGQQRTACRDGVDIISACTGKFLDFLSQNLIDLSFVQYFIIDEADRMLDQGFDADIETIFQNPQLNNEKEVLMFSATFPPQIQALANRYLTAPASITIGANVGDTVNFIEQRFVQCEERDKRVQLYKELMNMTGKVLIFVQKKVTAVLIEQLLYSCEMAVVSIHGDRTQAEREIALTEFKQGARPILIATDVAARGIDINDVEHVMNFDFPTTIEVYKHRIGRTGRIGKNGTSTTFINRYTDTNILYQLKDILRDNQQSIPDWMNNLYQQYQKIMGEYSWEFSNSNS